VYGFFDQAENTYNKIQKEMWVLQGFGWLSIC
jgi:hypothetical protein